MLLREVVTLPKFQRLHPEEFPFFFTWLMLAILDEQIPPPQGTSNPRVVKKRVSKFPSKNPAHRGTVVKQEALTFDILSTA